MTRAEKILDAILSRMPEAMRGVVQRDRAAFLGIVEEVFPSPQETPMQPTTDAAFIDAVISDIVTPAWQQPEEIPQRSEAFSVNARALLDAVTRAAQPIVRISVEGTDGMTVEGANQIVPVDAVKYGLADFEYSSLFRVPIQGRSESRRYSLPIPVKKLVQWLKLKKKQSISVVFTPLALVLDGSGFAIANKELAAPVRPAHPTFKVKGLQSALKSTLKTVYQDPSRFALECIEIRLDPNPVRVDEECLVVSTDGHRLTVCKLEVTGRIPVNAKPTHIHREIVKSLVKMVGDGEVAVGFESAGITLSVYADDNSVFTVRSPAVDYPNWRRVLPDDKAEHIEIDGEALKKAVEFAKIFDPKGVTLRTTPTRVEIAAENPDMGDTVVGAGPNPSGVLTTVHFDPAYLLDMCREMGDHFDFHPGDQLGDPHLFVSTDERKRIVIAPMRS